MRKAICFLLAVFTGCTVRSQELYVFSESASNMPSRSISAKLNYRLPVSTSQIFRQRYTPEIMLGVNRFWMVHLASSFSDFYTPQLRWESIRSYAKYRFYSNDDVHRHFRMAAFAEASYSRNPFYYGDINLEGDNSGVQAGLIATQLLNKLAVSGTASVIKIFGNNEKSPAPPEYSQAALYYSLSAGWLLLPVHYSDYKQTNLNLYLEAIGMRGLGKGGYMLDLAPALQVIFNSNFKINLGVRLQVNGDMPRLARNNYFIGLERTFLGAWSPRKKTL